MSEQHLWIPSTLGHGEQMCSRCRMTNREAMVLGMDCLAPPARATPTEPETGEAMGSVLIPDP